MLFYFVLIANDISGIGSGNLEDPCFYVGDEFASFNLGRRYFHAVFVFYFIISALSGDTPAVQTCHFLIGIEEDKDGSVLTPTGTKDFIRLANYDLDLVSGHNVDVGLGIQQHGVGLLVVFREWRTDGRMHPLRRISR